MAERSVEPIVAARRHPTPDTEQSETKKSLRVYIMSLSGIAFGGRKSRMVPTGTAVSSEEAGELAEPRGFFLMRCEMYDLSKNHRTFDIARVRGDDDGHRYILVH